MQSADAYVVKALKSGALGYVLKDTGPTEIIQAVQEVITGGVYLSPKISSRLVSNFLNDKEDILSDPYDNLTDRERRCRK